VAGTRVRQSGGSKGNTPNKSKNGGKAKASEAEPASRRETIVALAAELFAKKGVASTTVRDIGEAAGILSGSLYYHFPSKEAIVEEIILAYLRELIDRYRAVLEEHTDARARLEGLIRTSFQAIDEHQHACEIFQNDYKYLRSLPQLAELDALNEDVQKIWISTIDQGVREGSFRSDIEPRMFYRFARDAIWFSVRWYHPGGRNTVERMSTACIAVLLDGFGRPG
jgi:AcrR family transcriptional regulator